MERKELSQVPIRVRDAYNRAVKSIATGNIDTSIYAMKLVVQEVPGLMIAREKLRELERRRTQQMNIISKVFFQFIGLFYLPLIMAKAGKDPVAALNLCEEPLAKCVDNPPVLSAMADIAEKNGFTFIAAEALLIVREFHPNNEANSRRLAAALQANNQACDALKIFQELARKYPGDLAVQGELRSAMALASIERGRASSASGKDSAESKAAVTQQLIDGSIHDLDQAQTLIKKFSEDLAANDSIDLRRKLADAYLVAKDYEAAIREMKIVAKKMGTLDPALDKAIEKAYMSQLDQAIGQLRANPEAYENADEQIAELEAEKFSYRLRKAEQRVKVYPNDAMLQFDLAELYFEKNDFDRALKAFQLAARSPQKRTLCLVYLGRCFDKKGQFDIAVEQFTAALKDMIRVDRQRLDTLYYLGQTYEDAGNMEKAMECYKEIYQNQADYGDVAARIDNYYASRG